jgi:hypothetical protein
VLLYQYQHRSSFLISRPQELYHSNTTSLSTVFATELNKALRHPTPIVYLIGESDSNNGLDVVPIFGRTQSLLVYAAVGDLSAPPSTSGVWTDEVGGGELEDRFSVHDLSNVGPRSFLAVCLPKPSPIPPVSATI